MTANLHASNSCRKNRRCDEREMHRLHAYAGGRCHRKQCRGSLGAGQEPDRPKLHRRRIIKTIEKLEIVLKLCPGGQASTRGRRQTPQFFLPRGPGLDKRPTTEPPEGGDSTRGRRPTLGLRQLPHLDTRPSVGGLYPPALVPEELPVGHRTYSATSLGTVSSQDCRRKSSSISPL